MSRGSNSRNSIILILLAVVVLAGGSYYLGSYLSGGSRTEAVGRKVLYWRAPMDPTFISDKPGKSPMGMDLVPVYADEQDRKPSDSLTGAARTESSQAMAAAGDTAGGDVIYTCAMHPEVIQDHPGRCPQCGMELVKKVVERGALETVYSCPMHPDVISHEPGKCPICGMDLVKKEIPKVATVNLTADITQKIGVRTALVDYFPLHRTIRTVGHITYDETRVVDITTKIGGWVEKLYVDFTGQSVRKGQPLIDIYSPELVSTQEEYLLALKSRDALGQSQFPEVRDGAASLLNSTRRRLQLWDISDRQIERLEKNQTVQKTMTIYSPRQGVVTDKKVFEGGYVTPDMPLYRIADLTRVWVDVSIYEYELPWVALGQKVVMTLPYNPGKAYEGEIIFIYPYLEEKTRTVKARLEFPNPDGELKPEMYADVLVESPLTVRALAVPDEAVIHSGERNIVVVDRGNGVFEPRGITLGVEADNHYQVLEGLQAGDRVVTSAQFLIDSESRLKEAIQKMLAHQKAGAGSGVEKEPGTGESKPGMPAMPGAHQH